MNDDKTKSDPINHRIKGAAAALIKENIDIRKAVLPYLEFKDKSLASIDFNRAETNERLTDCSRALLHWLRAIWTGESHGSDLMVSAASMDANAHKSLLNALKILWDQNGNK